MLTDDQISELANLLKENKKKKQSIRIADVTKVMYPVEKNSRQHKLRSTS